MFYRVQFEFEVDAESHRDAAKTILGWFHDGMMPTAEVCEIDDNSKAVGESQLVDLEDSNDDEVAQADKAGEFDMIDFASKVCGM